MWGAVAGLILEVLVGFLIRSESWLKLGGWTHECRGRSLRNARASTEKQMSKRIWLLVCLELWSWASKHRSWSLS